jgi:hypothetical protein
MALIDFDARANRLVIRFDQEIPLGLLESGRVSIVRMNEAREFTYYHIDTNYGDGEYGFGLQLYLGMYPEALLDFIMKRCRESRIGFSDGGQFVHDEPLTFTSRVMSLLYDPITFNMRKARDSYEKPGKLAVFTQVFNEEGMLAMWERYYGEQVGYENLYVIDNGTTDGSCAKLDPRTNVVRIPAGALDHEHFAQLQGQFQRFLLQRYQWVIKVDADELLVCEGDLVETVLALPPGIHAPLIPVAVVHDEGREGRFDFTQPIRAQRTRYVPEHFSFRKPLIASVPITWMRGNHLCYEKSEFLPDFYLVHARYIDFEHLIKRHRRFAAMPQTKADADIYTLLNEYKSRGAQEMFDETRAELRGKLDEGDVAVPDWLRAKL